MYFLGCQIRSPYYKSCRWWFCIHRLSEPLVCLLGGGQIKTLLIYLKTFIALLLATYWHCKVETNSYAICLIAACVSV